MKMLKLVSIMLLSVTLVLGLSTSSKVSASSTYTVKSGDTMWKIAMKYQVGVPELIQANSQLSNPNLIYPGQRLSIPTTNQTSESYTNEVVKLVNQERARAGLAPLKENWELSRVARYKSEDMIAKNYFSHTSPTYGSPFQMMKDFGISYQAAGENIAAGQRTPQEVVQAWMNSEGHRKNIMSPTFTEIGVGYAKGGSYGHYWTQMFIKR
ncbi:SafA/ExsA family spore coat assembly protein [Rossellomorea sp. BNER]|uniref:SafA/ExsA family spore coat assembly protein n=1 Tax=Rossellomorea sp. BNER TaxID=2962031 RepID=UPI003AF24330